MSDHKCSVEKLDVQWQSYRDLDGREDGDKLPPPKWRANFICTECGKERTWEQLIEVMPFKELTDGPRS